MPGIIDMTQFENAFSSSTISTTEYLAYEANYNWLVKFYNYCFFGNGKYFSVPVFWIVVLVICFLNITVFSSEPDPLWISVTITIIVELSVNVIFGFYFCKYHILAKMILSYQQKYQLDPSIVNKYFQLMSICFGLGLFVVLIFTVAGYALFYNSTDDYNLSVTEAFSTTSTILLDFLVIGASFYLCMIWCLQMLIVYHSTDIYFGKLITLKGSKNHQDPRLSDDDQTIPSPIIQFNPSMKEIALKDMPSTTARSEKDIEISATDDYLANLFPQLVIEKSIVDFLHEMRIISNIWYFNHIIRTITGVIIVSYVAIAFYLVFTYSKDIFTAGVLGFVVITYYGIIWITAFSTGSANDHFFRFILRRLSSLYVEHGQFNDKLDQRIHNSIAKVEVLRTVDGLHFAGVTMSKEKALTVGSILASIILFCLKLFLHDNI